MHRIRCWCSNRDVRGFKAGESARPMKQITDTHLTGENRMRAAIRFYSSNLDKLTACQRKEMALASG